jgi:hypothetical protein
MGILDALCVTCPSNRETEARSPGPALPAGVGAQLVLGLRVPG